MRIAYFDCSSGISGDMTLGALIDAGVDVEPLRAGIASLGLPDCRLEVETVKKAGFRATQIRVVAPPEHKHRHLHHILEMLRRSSLTEKQQTLAERIFTTLAEAEAKVHGSTLEKVHFHEVGAVDSIADIVGTAIGLDLLAAEQIISSPVPTGQGKIHIAHGEVTVPAPGTAELLRGIPLAQVPIEAELTTPTGAAILQTVVDRFGPLPEMTIDVIGYGAGTRDLVEQANVLRLFVGEAAASAEHDTVWVLQTNLDDVAAEMVGYCTEELLEAGALDVYTTAIQMKKNRPGVMLSVLCTEADCDRLEEVLFRETTTFGVRRYRSTRRKLARTLITVTTPWGTVEGKVGSRNGKPVTFAPEYEACAVIAREKKIPLRTVYQAAQAAFFEQDTTYRAGGPSDVRTK